MRLFNHPFRLLVGLLLLKSFAILAFILYGGLNLGPDEAQYWTWSQALDWGYYSKPPGIAWQIWLGTKLFGSTELGVRAFSVILSFIQSCSVYYLARQCSLEPKWAFWSGMLMAFTPIGILGSFLAITDDGFLLFWILSCAYLAGKLNQQQEASPFVIGLFILLGALFKWPMYTFWLFFLWARWRYFPRQSITQSFLGTSISLLGLLPSVWWNLTHDWATFRHVSATIQGGTEDQGGHFLAFIGSQAALFSPLIFGLFLFAGWHWMRQYRRLTPAMQLCGVISFVSFIFFALAACIQKIQGNWNIFIYPTAFILISDYLSKAHLRLIWLKAGLGLAIGLMAVSLILPALSFFPYKMNPFKHNQGWIAVKQELGKIGYQADHHFLAADKYQTASILSFYNEGQKRAYFLNLQRIRKNQFSYWPSLQEREQKKSGYFIWIENAPYLQKQMENKKAFYQEELQKYFGQVDFVHFAPLVYQGEKVVKGALIFKCSNYLDIKVEDINLY